MNSQEFVVENINKIVQEYPFVQCTYQFDKLCGLHTIEILPKHYLNNAAAFGELQFGITKKFISLFPFERLSFFSIDNSVELETENIIYKVKGKCFNVAASNDVELFPDYKIHIPNFDSVIDKDNNYALAA